MGGFTVRRRTVDGDVVEQHEVPTPGAQCARQTPVDIGKLRSLRFGALTHDRVVEGRRADGVRIKATTDELNTTVTEHAKGDRQDVHVRPAQVTGQLTIKEAAAWLQKIAPVQAGTQTPARS